MQEHVASFYYDIVNIIFFKLKIETQLLANTSSDVQLHGHSCYSHPACIILLVL